MTEALLVGVFATPQGIVVTIEDAHSGLGRWEVTLPWPFIKSKPLSVVARRITKMWFAQRPTESIGVNALDITAQIAALLKKKELFLLAFLLILQYLKAVYNPDCPSKMNVIKSHGLQENGILDKIAEDIKGSLNIAEITVSNIIGRIKGKTNYKFQTKPIAASHELRFWGFCDYCSGVKALWQYEPSTQKTSFYLYQQHTGMIKQLRLKIL